MAKTVLHNCTVEFEWPNNFDLEVATGATSTIRVAAREATENLTIRCGDGDMAGKVIRLKRVLLEVRGRLLPVLEGDKVVLFTVEDEVKPDAEVRA